MLRPLDPSRCFLSQWQKLRCGNKETVWEKIRLQLRQARRGGCATASFPAASVQRHVLCSALATHGDSVHSIRCFFCFAFVSHQMCRQTYSRWYSHAVGCLDRATHWVASQHHHHGRPGHTSGTERVVIVAVAPGTAASTVATQPSQGFSRLSAEIRAPTDFRQAQPQQPTSNAQRSTVKVPAVASFLVIDARRVDKTRQDLKAEATSRNPKLPAQKESQVWRHIGLENGQNTRAKGKMAVPCPGPVLSEMKCAVAIGEFVEVVGVDTVPANKHTCDSGQAP
ncbi:hypothetical protein IWX47DRAFT_114249 [Phyllosticta citricarpa]